jgi:hypothetical protein
MLPPHWCGLILKQIAILELTAIINQAMLDATQYGTIRLPPKKVNVKIYKSIILFYPFYLDVAHYFSH